MKARLVLFPDGRGFVEGEDCVKLPHKLSVGEQRRATHILPQNFWRQLAFRFLRRRFGDTGRVAAWTRTWKGPWIVDFSPLGVDRVEGPFATYQEAVDYEFDSVLTVLTEHVRKQGGQQCS